MLLHAIYSRGRAFVFLRVWYRSVRYIPGLAIWFKSLIFIFLLKSFFMIFIFWFLKRFLFWFLYPKWFFLTAVFSGKRIFFQQSTNNFTFAEKIAWKRFKFLYLRHLDGTEYFSNIYKTFFSLQKCGMYVLDCKKIKII